MIEAFVNGCIDEDEETIKISIQALSFLITNKFLYSQYVPLEEKKKTYWSIIKENNKKLEQINSMA